MQASQREVIFFIGITTGVILLLTSLVVSILYLYQKRQILYNNQITMLKTSHDNTIMTLQIEIQESILQHISREIHDNINLSLTLAKLHLNTIDLVERDAIACKKIDSSIDLITQTIQDLKALSKNFHSQFISDVGLMSAIDREIKKISELNLFQIDVETIGDPVFMDDQQELLVFRIIQEAFNNIIKHSKASKSKLKLLFGIAELEFTIEDDGCGIACFDSLLDNENAGLRNMHTRAFMLGGTMRMESSKGNGTKLYFQIPYNGRQS